MSSGANAIRFGTDGWRAVMCDTFTFSNVGLVCQAIAAHLVDAGLADQGVVVAHDPRFLAERFAQEAAEIMVGNGIRVWLPSKDVPTPVAAHAVVQLKAAGAIMFTASHNPPEYNGIKFIPAYGGPASLEITTSIEKHLAGVMAGDVHVRRASLEANPLVAELDPRPDYTDHLSKLVDLTVVRKAGLRVAYDAMHGAGRNYMGELLESAGVQATTLRTSRDALFGGGPPEPMVAYLPDLVSLVRSGAADLGLATDGDADRFGVIDAGGDYISPNEVVSLLLPYLVEHRGMQGSVVRTVATTHLIDRIASHFGLTVHETPVGFKHICEWMRREPVVIGGEESGGLSIGGHIPEKDGILADLLVAEARAVIGMPLRQYLNMWARRVGPATSRRVDLRYPEEKKMPLIARLREQPPERLGSRRTERVITIDGAKLVFADGSWMLVRASGTEPLLRIYLEASDVLALDELEAEARRLVDAIV